MEMINEYTVAIVMALCFCIGYIVKKWVKDIDNKWIPTISMLFGVFFNVWVNDWSISPEILLGGFASGLAATGFDQLIRTKK